MEVTIDLLRKHHEDAYRRDLVENKTVQDQPWFYPRALYIEGQELEFTLLDWFDPCYIIVECKGAKYIWDLHTPGTRIMFAEIKKWVSYQMHKDDKQTPSTVMTGLTVYAYKNEISRPSHSMWELNFKRQST